MGRTVAVVWHASFSIAAGVLYFFFVVPRWPELLGETSITLGVVLRIVTGALIGLAALPVVFTLLRTRRPEYGTPQLALSLRFWAIVLHVLSGLLIVGTAISEIWLDLDSAGQWLFGIYGAAAAIGLLGMFAFYLAFVAELPPPPPKPLKPKEKKGRRGRRKAGDDETVDEAAEETTAEADEGQTADETVSDDEKADETEERSEESTDDKPAEVTAEAAEPEDTAEPEPEDTADSEPESGGLRNRRPAGKTETSRRRRRLRGGVAVED